MSNLVQEGCLQTKIYRRLAARVVVARRGSTSSMSRENVWVPRLRVDDLNDMVTTAATNVGTTCNIEEGTTEQDFKRGISHDLYLEEDGDRSELDRELFDHS